MYGEQFKRYLMDGTSLKRLGTVKEVASIISFVASPEASWINGEERQTVKIEMLTIETGNQIPANGGSMLALQG